MAEPTKKPIRQVQDKPDATTSVAQTSKKEVPAAKQRIRIRLKAYDHKVIDQSAKQIVDTALRNGATIAGPIPLPTRRSTYTVVKSPHVYKKGREQFEMRVHKRLIDVLDPSPKAVDRSAYTIRVLNGTGKSGLAAKIAGQLKDLGYKTEKVGNATNSAFKQTVVRVKSGEDALLEQLVKDLSGDFEADGQASLKSSESVDAEIILGAK